MYGTEDNKESYKNKIINLVESCDDERWLKAILTFVKRLLE